MKCFIAVCRLPATWEGVLSIVPSSDLVSDPIFELVDAAIKHDREVAYCDDHAWIQTNSVPDGLALRLTPIGQESK
jgi:hypothetical protein